VSTNDAATLIKQATELGASLQVQEGRLKWKAPSPLPADLVEAMRQHKQQIISLLQTKPGPSSATDSGAQVAIDSIAEALTDLRPYLPRALRQLPDQQLLALVNWAILVAWSKMLEKPGDSQTR